MEDLSARSSFGASGCHARPKFQPVRVKALLNFCESDDEESEEKTISSENETDCDDDRPLLLNESNEDAIDSSSQHMLDTKSISSKSKEVNVEVPSNTPFRQSARYSDAGATDSTTGPPVEMDTTLFDNVNKIEKKEEENDRKATISSASICVRYTRNGDVVSDTPWYGDSLTHDTIEDENNVDARSKLYQENVLGIRVDRNLETNTYLERRQTNAITEEHERSRKETLDHNRSEYKSYKSMDNGLEHMSCVLPNDVNTLRDINRVVSNPSKAKSPMDENHLNFESVPCSDALSIFDARSSAHSVVTDTPLKPTNLQSVRPNPCFSHRNILQTPQNKLQRGDLVRSAAHTPSTIFSIFSQSNARQTPLRSSGLSLIESAQTPVNSILNQGIRKNDISSSLYQPEKRIRQPLAITTCSDQFDSNNGLPINVFSTESKIRTLHNTQLSKVEEADNDVPPPDTSCRERHADTNFVTKENIDQAETKFMRSDVDANERSKKTRQDLNILDKAGTDENSIKEVIFISDKNVATAASSKPESINLEKENILRSENDVEENIKEVVDKISNVQFSLQPNLSTATERHKRIIVKNKEYLILGTLGRGMSGEVLRVQDLTSSELRAIKCVNLSRMDKDSAQGCLEEISMLHKLQAPCIVKMFDYEIKYPLVYVVMEMGDTDLSRLLKLISQEKKLPLTMIFYYWTEMLTAVKHIHDNGVIHSDLKPANFLLVRGRLKLIDFGIASSMNADMTSVVKSCPIGTLNYISPEALMDIGGTGDSPNHNVKYKITYKSDVWSLGCILYGLVYGQTPFHHIRSQWAKVNAITNPNPKIVFPTSVFLPDKTQKFEPPPILIDVMRKCLQHDPKARPTVGELLQIQYIPIGHMDSKSALCISLEIPPSILVKIKHALTEEEWRKLIQVLEKESR